MRKLLASAIVIVFAIAFLILVFTADPIIMGSFIVFIVPICLLIWAIDVLAEKKSCGLPVFKNPPLPPPPAKKYSNEKN